MNPTLLGTGAAESTKDYRRVTDKMIADMGVVLPNKGEVPLNMPSRDELCNQMRLGVCTKCGSRMAEEAWHNDGERLDEYWGYLMMKVLIDKHLYEGSSAWAALHCAYKYGTPSKLMLAKYPLYITGTYTQFIEDFISKYGGKIPNEIMEDAKRHKIPGYYQIENLTPAALATQINAGRVMVIRMLCGDNFYKDKNGVPTWDEKALLPLRVAQQIDAGHIMAMNAYDGLSDKQILSGPNSWSDQWAKKGYYTLVFKTHIPGSLTEAWAIGEIPPEIGEVVGQLPSEKDFKYTFNKDINKGEKGEHVKALQTALMIEGIFSRDLFIELSQTNELGYFGNVTADCVIKYQIKRGIYPTAPRVGPRTRFELNKTYSK